MSNKQTVEMSGESIEEAIQMGLAELDVSRNDVSIDIVEEGSLGVLGIGKKAAIVRLTLLDGQDAAVESVSAPEPEVEAEAVVESDDSDEVEDALAEALVGISAEDVTPAATAATVDIQPELEQEAEIALDIVTTLIDKMGYHATVRADIGEPDDMNQRIVTVNVDGENLYNLVGENGDTLNKLQFLARSMASQRLSDRTSFVIDVDNYRQERQAELITLSKETADKAAEHKRPIAMAPMPPHERRIVHMTLRNDDRVTTESKGEGDRRRVRVLPKGMRSSGGGNRGGGRGRGGGNRGGRGRGGGRGRR